VVLWSFFRGCLVVICWSSTGCVVVVRGFFGGCFVDA